MSTAPTRLARIAGLLYLVVGAAAYGQLVVRPAALVSGDAAATAANVAADQHLFRLSFVTDLAAHTAFILLALVLFALLRHVDRLVAGAMVTFVALAVGIMSLNMVAHAGALLVATDGAFAEAMGAGGADALVLLLLELHEIGFGIAEIFFGLWLAPLGWLAIRSGYFPRPLGVLLIVAAGCYVVLAFVTPLADIGGAVAAALAIPPTIAEVGMIGYLLLRGVRSQPPAVMVSSAAA